MSDLGMFLNDFSTYCKMNLDMPKFEFPRAVHADVITTLVLFDNFRLTYGSLIGFDNKQYELVSGCIY